MEHTIQARLLRPPRPAPAAAGAGTVKFMVWRTGFDSSLFEQVAGCSRSLCCLFLKLSSALGAALQRLEVYCFFGEYCEDSLWLLGRIP